MPRCAANHTVYHTQKFETGQAGANGNCAHCVCDSYYRERALRQLSLDEHDTWGKCCPGWNGTECDVPQRRRVRAARRRRRGERQRDGARRA